MTVVVRALQPKAQRALADLYLEYREKLRQYNIAKKMIVLPRGHLAKLSSEYESKLKAIIREGMTETTNDRMVRVKCPGCKRVEQIAGDVRQWACPCSPLVVRWSFQTYEV